MNLLAFESSSASRPVVDLLRELIVSGQLRPGVRLTEMALCERFSVSRTPIREALRILTVEGLVAFTQNRGAAVREASLEEVIETFDVIGTLDAMAGELAAVHITPTEIEGIEETHRRMLEAVRADDLVLYAGLNQEIHKRIWTGSRNLVLAKELERLDARMRPYRYSVNLRPESWRKSILDHERILLALLNRDGRRLGQILRWHLPSKSAVLKAQMIEGPERA